MELPFIFPGSTNASILMQSAEMEQIDGRSGTYMVCGVSYRRTPVEIRERVSIDACRLPEALRFLIDQPGVRECMILSTCNRTELYVSVEPWLDGLELFLRFSLQMRDYDMTPHSDQVYVLTGPDAVAHLFRVSSSLDSLVLGEPQVLGQTKEAFRVAEAQGCIDRSLRRLVPRAFSVAKQVRNETGICEAAVNVSYAAVQLARKIFEDLSGKSVVLLGAGKMSDLAALYFKEAGVTSIVVANRTLSRAEELAGRCSGTAVEFERRAEQIAKADVVICSTDAPHFVLDETNVLPLLRCRARRPLLILDISVPRNVDPRLSGVDGVFLFDIDDLEKVVQANRRSRQAESLRAQAVVDGAVDRFLRDEAHARIAPAISAIRNQVRSICMTELLRLQQKMPELRESQVQELEQMLHRIAQKIVHPAIMQLKAENPDNSIATPGMVARLFGVDHEAPAC
jgi:glutamyl-tRNA reductase